MHQADAATRPRPPPPLTGGCPCGAIRYQVTALPLLLYACHCTNCQRQSGSALAINMPVRTETLRMPLAKAWQAAWSPP